MEISDRIVASRRTDKEIADVCQVAVPVVWRWRRGDTRPHIKSVRALARAIGCDPIDLIPSEMLRPAPSDAA